MQVVLKEDFSAIANKKLAIFIKNINTVPYEY